MHTCVCGVWCALCVVRGGLVCVRVQCAYCAGVCVRAHVNFLFCVVLHLASATVGEVQSHHIIGWGLVGFLSR